MCFAHTILLPDFSGWIANHKLMTFSTHILPQPIGGRRSSPQFRDSLAHSDEFSGLPEGTTHFDLLKLVKRAGREIGFSERMIQLLEYYLLFTREQDWRAGARPVVYQSLYKTALDFGVGERQIQKLEHSLFQVGALTWADSGNHRRYGIRDEETGDILYAFGVDLSPLATLAQTLQTKLEEKSLRDAAWLDTKRKISALRAKIRALMTELPEDQAPEAQAQYLRYGFTIRAYMPLEDIIELLQSHRDLYATLMNQVQEHARVEVSVNNTLISSSMDASMGAHKYSTNYESSDKSDNRSSQNNGFQESVAEDPPPPGYSCAYGTKSVELTSSKEESSEDEMIRDAIAKITWKQVMNAASDRFREHIPLHPRPLEWQDLVEAAGSLLPELGIHRSAWREACQILGKSGAAICVMIIDQKVQNEEQTIRNPGGYLREMTARAKRGELNLHRSVFGLLRRNTQEKTL